MFREQLKKDLDGISPDEELMNRVTRMMQEAAAKPRQPKYVPFMRFAGMAAAVCMIVVGAGALYNTPKAVSETAAEDMGMAEGLAACDMEKAADESGAEAEITAATTEAAVYYSETEPQIDTTVPVEEIAVAEETVPTEKTITLPDFENKGVYTSGVSNPHTTGQEMTYIQIISGRENEIDSFYKIKITGVLTKEQAAELSGYNADIDEAATFYNAEIQQDYINGTALSESIILRLSGDNQYNVEYGNPCYTAGDTIAVVLQKSGDGDMFRRRFSFAFAYDVYEIDGVSYIAVRNQRLAEVTEGLTDYFGGKVVEYETTTANNPAIYYGLYEISGVIENLKALFEEYVSSAAVNPLSEATPAEQRSADETYDLEGVAATAYTESITSYYKGVEAPLNGQEHYEIICTVLAYAAENPDKRTDPAFSKANIESFAQYGVSVCYETAGGKRIRVLVDDIRSYIQANDGFYRLEGESRDKVMSHFGAAEIIVDIHEAVFKGQEAVLTETEAYEIWTILCDYAVNNGNKSLNKEYMDVDFDSVCQNGLYFYVGGYHGEKAYVYIDSQVSYAVVDRDYYIFEGESRDKVLEYFGTIENMYTTPKMLIGGEVLYGGEKYTLSDSELKEIGGIVETYTKENTHRITDKALTDEEIGEYEKSGLAITLRYDEGSEVRVFADDENAYICGEYTYHLGPNLHTQVITYAEAVKLKKMFGL